MEVRVRFWQHRAALCGALCGRLCGDYGAGYDTKSGGDIMALSLPPLTTTPQAEFLEIYLERIRDLLDTNNANMQIRESPEKVRTAHTKTR